jgi:TaqI-like C-terminal specificity domain
VIKGTNLRQFRITDELPRQEPPAYIQRVLEELRQPKLVVAQSLSHIKKPYDTLILMSALDRQGCVALDTVNQIFPHADCPYSLELLGALLNSSFARWYFYFAIFNRATRVTECTPAELGRLPMPARPPASLVAQAERLTRKLCKAELPRKYLLRGQIAEYDTLDDIICELYGLSEEERDEILRLS